MDPFNSAGLPAREQVTSWVSIKNVIGDKIYGEFLGWWISPPSGDGFKEQLGVALKITNLNQVFKDNKNNPVVVAAGDVVGVSLGSTDYMKSRIEPSIVGDVVGIKYESDKDTGKPQKAKIVKFYNQALEERRKAGNMKSTPVDASLVKDSQLEDTPF